MCVCARVRVFVCVCSRARARVRACVGVKPKLLLTLAAVRHQSPTQYAPPCSPASPGAPPPHPRPESKTAIPAPGLRVGPGQWLSCQWLLCQHSCPYQYFSCPYLSMVLRDPGPGSPGRARGPAVAGPGLAPQTGGHRRSPRGGAHCVRTYHASHNKLYIYI